MDGRGKILTHLHQILCRFQILNLNLHQRLNFDSFANKHVVVLMQIVMFGLEVINVVLFEFNLRLFLP